MRHPAYPSTTLHIRLTRSPAGAIRIDHAYARGAEPDEFRPFVQIAGGERRIRRVWNELRVLVAVWLERDRVERISAPEERSGVSATTTTEQGP